MWANFKFVFHVELRRFPHSFWRFNLTEQELRETLLSPWVQGASVEAGERRWSPEQTTLTVLEGPRLAMSELAMGRGWRNAQRRGEDVSERMIEAERQVARQAQRQTARETQRQTAREAEHPRAGGAPEPSLDDCLRELLGPDAQALLTLWRSARERHPERTASQCLALAEEAVRALEGR